MQYNYDQLIVLRKPYSHHGGISIEKTVVYNKGKQSKFQVVVFEN